jgi:hypothetical protein
VVGAFGLEFRQRALGTGGGWLIALGHGDASGCGEGQGCDEGTTAHACLLPMELFGEMMIA